MKKKIVAVVIALTLLCLAVIKIFKDNNNPSKTLQEVKENLSSYYMESDMTIYNGEDRREFVVKVSYEKDEEVDLFKVDLFDKGINQEQIIIKNKDGVYVLTPSLNQVYEFKGSWPMNSPKPYIYQSMLDFENLEHELKEVDGGYLISSKPNFDNKIQWATQEIKFDKEYKPEYLNIYDTKNNLALNLNIRKLEINKDFEDDYFNVESSMIQARENSTYTNAVVEEELPFLPVNTEVESSLKESSTYEINGFGIYHDGVLTYCYNSVEYNIYSEVLTLDEMIELANGVEVSYAK